MEEGREGTVLSCEGSDDKHVAKDGRKIFILSHDKLINNWVSALKQMTILFNEITFTLPYFCLCMISASHIQRFFFFP